MVLLTKTGADDDEFVELLTPETTVEFTTVEFVIVTLESGTVEVKFAVDPLVNVLVALLTTDTTVELKIVVFA